MLESSQEGLTSAEADRRRKRLGPNVLPARRRTPLWRLFLRQFKSPLIYLLLAAVLLSLFLGELTDAGFIAIVLAINAAIGGIQEYKAEASTAALQKLIRQEARVRRDGGLTRLDASELVPGDIVELESGMAIPADIRLLSANLLEANESTFSGESLPVPKDPLATVGPDAGLSDRPTMLYAGTSVTQGRGMGVVVATGSTTALGAIQSSLVQSAAPPPPLVMRLQLLAGQIAVVAVLVVTILAVLLLADGHPRDDIFLLAVALTVSAVPEGLPIAVTVALAAATSRMARRNVIVRSLPAVEGLGACTLIACDKTGTLTLNRLRVERVLLPGGGLLKGPNWPSSAQALANAGAHCNEAVVSPGGDAVGDSVDVALLGFARQSGVDFEAAARAPRLCQLPYEPARKFAAVAVQDSLYVKGAPETVLPMCRDAAGMAAAEALAAQGYRILALASRPLAPGEIPDCAAPSGLALLGFVGLTDPVRPEVPPAVADCRRAGIKVRMITGDHPATALTISRELGLAQAGDEVVTGAQIRALASRPAELASQILGATVFARIEPSQKLVIVETFAASGEIVAVTGDGVNDAPALQAARIGVAMGRDGTDVAREASDLVLTDDNFASIVAGIEEGRITYSNIRKIVVFLLATGIAEIAMFIGAVVAGLPMPLTPLQLIWVNLVTNGAQDVMLGFGKGEGDELRRRPRRPDEPIVDGSALALMIPPALFMSIVALAMLWWLLRSGEEIDAARNAVLLLVVLFQNVYVLCVRSERRPIWREPLASNPWLLGGVLLALSLHVIAMAWQPLAGVLETQLVDQTMLLLCAAGAVGILLVTELTKALVARRVAA